MASVSKQRNILAELNDKLSERRRIYDSNEFPKSDGDSPARSPVSVGKSPLKPHPPVKNRSESLTDLQKHRVNQTPLKLSKSSSEDPKTFTQSVAMANNFSVGSEEFRSHSKSLPKGSLHSVVGPPPAKPPPTLSSKEPLRPAEKKEVRSPVTTSPKKKRKAHKLIKKFKKKQTNKVSEIPISSVAMDTMTPPSSGSQGYQNIFDFTGPRDTAPYANSESLNRTPKKPKPLPRTNSMSTSSIHSVSSPDKRTPQSDMPLINTPDASPKIEQFSRHRLVARRQTRRKTTKREAKVLRNGVCSDSEIKDDSSSDEDGYITMNPSLLPMVCNLAALPTFDPRASGYYLKILPPEVQGSRDRRALSEEPQTGAEVRRALSVPDLLDSDKPCLPTSLELCEDGAPSSPTSPEYVHMESWLTESGESIPRTESVDRDVPSSWLPAAAVVVEDPERSLPASRSTLGNSPNKINPLTVRSSNSLGAKSSLSTTPNRLIKYSDVTIHPVDGLPRKPSHPQKFKYQTVSLKQEEDKPQPLPVPARSPANPPSQPIDVPSSHERVYYKTTSSLVGGSQPNNLTAPPLTQSLPARNLDWHGYTEIDVDEIEVSHDEQSSNEKGSSGYKVTPPSLPDRPDDLDGWVQSVHSKQHVVSGDYSYVKRDAMMPMWLTSGHRKLVEMRSCQLDSKPSQQTEHKAPHLPPKTDSLLREVGLRPFPDDTTPEPYLYPVFMKKRNRSPGDKHRVTQSKVQRIKKRTNKSDTPPPVKPYKPKGKSLPHKAAMATMSDVGPHYRHQVVATTVSTTVDVPHPKSPPINSPPPTMLATPTGRRGSNSSLSSNTSNNNNQVTSPLPVEAANGCGCDLTSHMDRHSLAVLCQNRSEIVRRLSQRKDSESSQPENKEMPAESDHSVRNLDEVVLELDRILRQRLCSKTDLIRAIESQLNIQLSSPVDEPHYENGAYLASLDVTESKPRSGTVICHDSDSDIDISTPTHIHTRTQSSPAPALQISRPPHPRTQSNPITSFNKVDTSTPRNTGSNRSSPDGQRKLSAPAPNTRCYSNGWNDSPLKRANAQRRTSASALEDVGMVMVYTDGHGLFTSKGGRLTRLDSAVQVEVPKGAVVTGQRQRLWFDVVQTVIKPHQAWDQEHARSLSDLSCDDHMTNRRDRQIQLSPQICVGPSDAVLNQPIKIKLPHCLPYRNNSWHLQLLARPHNSSEDSWTEVPNTMGLVNLQSKKLRKNFRGSSCQLHLDYITITTCELGYFKLMGRPVRNGVQSAKQMLVSVFTKAGRECDNEPLTVEVYITDSLTDHVQALQPLLTSRGLQCLLPSGMPVLCFGDCRDMELLISSQSVPLGTVVIPFRQFWRQNVIGQSSASFQVDPTLLGTSRTLTLKVQQAGAKYIHETNFLVP